VAAPLGAFPAKADAALPGIERVILAAAIVGSGGVIKDESAAAIGGQAAVLEADAARRGIVRQRSALARTQVTRGKLQKKGRPAECGNVLVDDPLSIRDPGLTGQPCGQQTGVMDFLGGLRFAEQANADFDERKALVAVEGCGESGDKAGVFLAKDRIQIVGNGFPCAGDGGRGLPRNDPARHADAAGTQAVMRIDTDAVALAKPPVRCEVVVQPGPVIPALGGIQQLPLHSDMPAVEGVRPRVPVLPVVEAVDPRGHARSRSGRRCIACDRGRTEDHEQRQSKDASH